MSLTEDEIENVLYAARVNEPAELKQYLAEVQQRQGGGQSTFQILNAAADAESGNTALHYAAANGHTDIIALVPSLITASETSPSNLALGPADVDALHTFLNRPNSAGNTALHWAALNGHLSAVQLLVKLGANPALTNNIGHDAVFEAERNDKEEIVKWFLAEVPGLEQAVGNGTNGQDQTKDDEMDIDADAADDDGFTLRAGQVDADEPDGRNNSKTLEDSEPA